MKYLFRRLYHEQEGQAIFLVASLLVSLLGMAALSIDIGFAVHAQRELQASADAAATAGALDLSNNLSSATAINTAYCFSGVGSGGFGGSRTCPPNSAVLSSGINAYNDLGGGVTMVSDSTATYPTATCLSQLTALGLACNNTASANAMAVEETVNAPTFFGKLFGINYITLKAQSLVAMKGGTPSPANLEIILDTTPSMLQTDSNCTVPGIGNPTKEDCAKYGVRTLLNELAPCTAGLSSCGSVTNGNVPNAVDEVAILTFPGLYSSSAVQNDYSNCQSSNVTNQMAAYQPESTSTPPYISIVPLSSDYKTSASSSLNGSSSDAVKAVDWADGAGCGTNAYGLQVGASNNPYGYNTYYATTINAAQAGLSAQSGERAKMQGAIILLSDGDSQAKWNTNGPPAPSGNCNRYTQNCSDFTTSTPQSDAQYQCHKAITNAQTAANTTNAAGLKTWVYAIAYQSSTSSSSSCAYDRNPPPTSTDPNPTSEPISGCTTMEDIASDPNKFYSDDSAGCQSAAHPSITSLSSIFKNISYDFLTTRLLPVSWYNGGIW
ncbi:MAG: pilus assembly protein TadG-related protein [Terriglobia bacterium]